MKQLSLLFALCFLAIHTKAQNKYTQTEAYKQYVAMNEMPSDWLSWTCGISEKSLKKMDKKTKKNLEIITTDFCKERYFVEPQTNTQRLFIANIMMRLHATMNDSSQTELIYIKGFPQDTIQWCKKYDCNTSGIHIVQIKYNYFSGNGRVSGREGPKSRNQIFGYAQNDTIYMVFSNRDKNTLETYTYKKNKENDEIDTYTLIKQPYNETTPPPCLMLFGNPYQSTNQKQYSA
jgi:hypothetical protein